MQTQVVWLLLRMLAVSVLLSCCGPSYAYPDGAPDTACVDMFPSGHHSDSQTSSPPYEMLVSNTTLAASTQYSVTLKVKAGQTTNFKGMFVQARLADNCNNNTPLGTFSIPTESASFLKLMNCAGGTNNAVTQTGKVSQTTKTFSWTSPSTIPGTIYFRATVVYEEHTFWTPVFSEMLKPSSATSNLSPCTVKTTGGASPSSGIRLITAIACLIVIALLL